MGLLKDFDGLSAEKTLDKGEMVVTGLKGNKNFETLKEDVTQLEAACSTLSSSIIQRNMRNHTSNVAMTNAKADVVSQMEVVRKKAEVVCNGDENLERETGFSPSKRGRSTRKSIAAAVVASVKATTVRGQLDISLAAAVYGNQGFEVHYVLDGKDTIAGVFKVSGRNLKLLATGLPSLKELEVYLITLSTNNLRSLPSNSVQAAAL